MYLKVEENMDADILKCSTDPICSIKSSTELSILNATVLQGITKSKSIKYSKWYVKHDKNRNEDEDEEVKQNHWQAKTYRNMRGTKRNTAHRHF